MILNEFDQIVKEYFNLFNAPTRRCISLLEDTEQTQMLNALSSALYKKITSDMDKIDFGSIPRSRGDITKIDKYEDMEECLIIMKKLVQEYKQDTEIVDTVLLAIDNIQTRKAKFQKGFALNVGFVTSLYNLMVLSIQQSVSFLISICIQYVKDPETESIKMALDKVSYYNTKDSMLYEQIVAFNESSANGSLDKVLDAALSGKGIKECGGVEPGYSDIAMVARVDGVPDREIDVDLDKNGPVEPQVKDVPDVTASVVHEEEPEDDEEDQSKVSNDGLTSPNLCINGQCATNESLGGILALGFGAISLYKLLLKVFIPMMRNTVYFLMYSGLKRADTLEVRANLIELNAYKLQAADITDDGFSPAKRKKIVDKQLKIANKLKKKSDKITLIFNKTEKKAKEEVAKVEKEEKYTVDDIKDDIPADVYNKSVLF